MYAIIRTGGKQYKVQAGDVIQVEKLDQKLGAEFKIQDVLMTGGETPVLGQPLVKGASVSVVVTKQAKARKVIVFKKKRRQGYRKFNTHRQEFTELFVVSITGADGKTSKTDAKPNVVDMAAKRADRITAKQEARRERVENKSSAGETLKTEAKKAAKKKTAKKVAKKAAKKSSGKKVAKKAAKKTSKKA